MKRLRLDPKVYEQGATFSLTLATTERQRFFLSEEVVTLCLRELRIATARYSAAVYAYCFMPDHLHLLVAVPEGVSLVNFVRHFKQLTAHRFRRLAGHDSRTLWQPRFYDHALRKEEELETVAAHIWGNPVRADLVSDLENYPHWGSLAWNLEAQSGSEDPDLQKPPAAPRGKKVGESLQTLVRTTQVREPFGSR